MALKVFWIVVLIGFLLFLYSAMDLNAKAEEQEEVPQPTTVADDKETWVKYPVPLSDGLQKFITQKCAKYQISPAVVMAVIGVESQYRADAIGDHGQSFGLMQIYKSYHEDRMLRLGVADLLDPYENVTVGIDILAELLDRGNGIEWALSYYSGYGGADCDYSRIVMQNAECLLEGVVICTS